MQTKTARLEAVETSDASDWVPLSCPELDELEAKGFRRKPIYGPTGSTISAKLIYRVTGELFDRREVCFARVTIAPPNGPPFVMWMSFEKIRQSDLDAFLIHVPDFKAKLDKTCEGENTYDEIEDNILDQEPYPSDIGFSAIEISEALSDETPRDDARYWKALIKQAYELGARVKEFELKRSYELNAVMGENHRAAQRKGAAARGRKVKADSELWQTKTVQWLNREIKSGAFKSFGKSPTKSDVAEWIEKNWDGRGFFEAPKTGKCPSFQELTQTYIPQWKKPPFDLIF